MIQGKYLNSTDDLTTVIHIRKEVFENELALYNNVTVEEKDNYSISVLVNDGQNNVGTGRVTLDDGKYTIDMVCVLKEYRHLGYGEFIVRLLADKALVSGANTISLDATPECVSFFEKLYFTRVDFDHINNTFIPMVVDLSQFKSPCGQHCKK